MGSHSYLQNMQYCSGSACNQMRYQLIEMPTNIGALRTSGLLNSHASQFTTTNVANLAGDRSSVINLGLQQLDFCPPGQMRLSVVDDCFNIPTHQIDITKQLY